MATITPISPKRERTFYRKPRGKSLSTVVPSEDAEWLEGQSRLQERTVSQVIRRAVLHYRAYVEKNFHSSVEEV